MAPVRFAYLPYSALPIRQTGDADDYWQIGQLKSVSRADQAVFLNIWAQSSRRLLHTTRQCAQRRWKCEKVLHVIVCRNVKRWRNGGMALR